MKYLLAAFLVVLVVTPLMVDAGVPALVRILFGGWVGWQAAKLRDKNARKVG